MALTQIDDRGLKTPIDLLDNEKIRIGTGNDLEIYHDGSDSRINATGTGNLIIKGDDVHIQGTNAENMANFNENAGVQLRYDGTTKFETTANGVTITGNDTGTLIQGDVSFYDSANSGYNMSWDQSTPQLKLYDAAKLVIGSGNDLEIWHDNSSNKSIIKETGSGSFDIQGNWVQILNEAGDESKAIFKDDGAVELYHDNVKKFETVATGVQFAQDFRCTNNAGDNTAALQWYKGGDALYFADSIKAKFGTGEDLQLYHDGSHSRIVDSGTGNLMLQSDRLVITDAGNSENQLVCQSDGAVELFYNGVKKFETQNGGCHCTGSLTADTVAVQDNEKFLAGNNDDLKIYHDGSNSFIENDTGELFISASQVNIKSAAGEYMAYFNDNGEAALYYDDAKKLETTNTGAEFTGTIHAFKNKGDSAHTSNLTRHVFQTDAAGSLAHVIENSHDSDPYGAYVHFSDDAPDNHTNYFLTCADNAAARCQIYSDGDVWTSDDSYLSSDETLKENITDATPKLEDLKKLKVRNFNWKASYHPEKSKQKQIGFIAQEVEQVFPALVSDHDIASSPPGDEHTPVMKKAIKTAWNPIIIKAMQELIAKVETLETKVAALEAV